MLPQEYYDHRLKDKQDAYIVMERRVDALSRSRLIIGILLLPALYLSIRQNIGLYWSVSAVLVALFLFTVKVHISRKQQLALIMLYINLIKDEIRALNNEYSQFADGAAYIDAAHPYSYDLDIFGKGSIYQMLCRTVTIKGAVRLADVLKSPYAAQEEIISRQETTNELAGNPEFLETFRVIGQSEKEEKKDREKITTWMSMPDFFLHKKYLVFLAYIVPACSFLLIILSVYQQSFHKGLFIMLAINWIVNLIHAKNIRQTHHFAGTSAALISKYEQLLHIISQASFNTVALNSIQQRAATSLEGIAKLKKLVNLFDSRQNGMVGPLMNSFFLFDTYCVLKLEKWRCENKELLLAVLHDVETIDSAISLAVYAFNNPADIYPLVNESKKGMQGKNVQHPLLPKRTAVGNDINIGDREQYYLLTGANMTGKSTFIRTIGINIVLTYAGLPVRANAMEIPLLEIYTAIRISDSVQDDLSYFKAELNRMKCIMDEVAYSSQQYLVLLDEPLRGTNAADKQQGTRAIIEKLIQHNSIGIVATHDTILADLEMIHHGKISNYHFESKLSENELIFDYKLKPGVSTSNNATALMKKIGII